jgi:hypothetical protein
VFILGFIDLVSQSSKVAAPRLKALITNLFELTAEGTKKEQAQLRNVPTEYFKYHHATLN